MNDDIETSAELIQSEKGEKQDTQDKEKIKATLRFIQILAAEGQSVQDITKELNDSEMTLIGHKFTDEIVRLALIKSTKDGETTGNFSEDINSILGINQ